MPNRLTKIIDIANRMRFSEKRLEVMANNLANLNTVGYKRDITFTKVLMDKQKVTLDRKTEYDQGDFVNTGNKLDVAINGDAFFMVTDGDQTYLTKNGKFNLTNDGYLVDSDGFKVLGRGGEITINEHVYEKEKLINISKDGEIKLGSTFVDKLRVVEVDDKEKLLKVGGSRFMLNDGDFKEADEDNFEILQGYLEESNVNPVIEMEQMITISKSFESIQKIIRNYDEILNQANTIAKVR
ncbi:MAG: flagellar hook-basal body protein [Ignavibacteria bacterium]|nr:MAG: flagellar hook-basal body protein [Ignavibacteria bacterium]